MSPLELSKLVADDVAGEEDESLTLASPDIRYRNRGETQHVVSQTENKQKGDPYRKQTTTG